MIGRVWLAAVFVGAAAMAGDNPVADAKTVVTAGNARFTMLTERLIRMEYSPSGKFEDRATLTFVNRRGRFAPEFSVERKGAGVVIDTGSVRLDYAGGEFSPATLSAEIRCGYSNGLFNWRYGDAPKSNLLGTTRTLDGVSGSISLAPRMEPGLLSRDGWALVDDSKNLVFAPSDTKWGAWVAPRNAEPGTLDLYLFAYGLDFRSALGDYIQFAGRIPLPPRFVFGYWWSRYWQYSDAELMELVEEIEANGLPMDVLIVDMDWHKTWGLGQDGGIDEFGQLRGWTGYTWQDKLFPDPKRFLAWCHAHGLKTALNLHPASGIQPMESCYESFCRDYGWAEKGKAVPYRMEEMRWADSYFKTVLGPLEDDGVDFWWLDWQQWLEAKTMKGLSNTFWINHVFDRHSAERAGGKRPLIYHRWGGLGSHRYQVGFSGDTSVCWDTLAVLPWFTATSANVGYGYWGHDIGGHHEPHGNGRDGELFLRWLQSGVFTPIFRTHSSRTPEIERRIWSYPGERRDMKDAFDLRYRLAPYIYTAAREAYDTGVSICHPLYYDYAECEEAYDRTLAECAFGSDIISVTVARPVDPATAMAPVGIWLPRGRWYDAATGEVLEGDRRMVRNYTLAENPWFVRAGAILPMNPASVRNLAAARGETLELFCAPGGGENSSATGELYEDDGISGDYATRSARTPLKFTTGKYSLSVTVGARKGDFTGALPKRNYVLRFPNALPCASVTVNGKSLDYAQFEGAVGWTYDGSLPGVVVTTESLPCDRETIVQLAYDDIVYDSRLDGVRMISRRLAKLTEEFKTQYFLHVNYMAMLPDDYLALAGIASALSAHPENADAILTRHAAARESFGKSFAPIAAKFDKSFSSRLVAQMTGAEYVASADATCLESLAVDYQTSPKNVGASPVFSCRTADQRSLRQQTAYQIRVTAEGAKEPLWDSGTVFDSKSVALPYAGPALAPNERYRFEMRTRDDLGAWTPWASGSFATGDLAPERREDGLRDIRLAAAGKVQIVTGNATLEACAATAAAENAVSQLMGARTDFATLLPHALYERSGDRRILANNIGLMEKFVAERHSHLSGKSSVEEISGAVVDRWLMKEITACLGDRDANDRHLSAENEVRALFRSLYCDESGLLKREVKSVADLVWVLKCRYLKPGSAAKTDAIARLEEALAKDSGAWKTAGAATTLALNAVAEDCGKSELAATLALAVGDSAKDPVVAAAVSSWMLRTLAGIRSNDLRYAPGFKNFYLEPKPDRRVGSLAVRYECGYGTIESAWRYDDDGRWHWHFTVPANTRAFVVVPGEGVREYEAGDYEVVR